MLESYPQSSIPGREGVSDVGTIGVIHKENRTDGIVSGGQVDARSRPTPSHGSKTKVLCKVKREERVNIAEHFCACSFFPKRPATERVT